MSITTKLFYVCVDFCQFKGGLELKVSITIHLGISYHCLIQLIREFCSQNGPEAVHNPYQKKEDAYKLPTYLSDLSCLQTYTLFTKDKVPPYQLTIIEFKQNLCDSLFTPHLLTRNRILLEPCSEKNPVDVDFVLATNLNVKFVIEKINKETWIAIVFTSFEAKQIYIYIYLYFLNISIVIIDN